MLLPTNKTRLFIVFALILFGMWHKEIHQFFSPPAKPSSACEAQKAAVLQQIDAEAHCTTDADCQPSSLNCPFRCGVALAKTAALSTLAATVARYTEQCGACVEECAEQTAQCVAGHCVMK